MQIKFFPDGIPTLDDYLLMQSASDDSFRKILIGNLPSSGNASWAVSSNDYTFQSSGKLILNLTNEKTVTLPVVSFGEIELFNISGSAKAFINLQGKKYNSANYQTTNLVIQGANKYVRLIYLNDSIGWYPLVGQLNSFVTYPSGMSLRLDDGSLLDKSGNNNNASPVGANSPSVATGLDSKQVLRWNGAGNQELQINPFLSGTSEATLYCVFTVSANTNYNLIRTANIDDYWRFTNNGAGYFGTFQSSRIEAYPLGMPSSGSHLVSIHASANSYEVILDNVSKGVQSRSYSAGDRFRIGTNDKAFNGDIALILVYPQYIDKASTTHINCVQTIKSSYPSLPFTI